MSRVWNPCALHISILSSETSVPPTSLPKVPLPKDQSPLSWVLRAQRLSCWPVIITVILYMALLSPLLERGLLTSSVRNPWEAGLICRVPVPDSVSVTFGYEVASIFNKPPSQAGTLKFESHCCNDHSGHRNRVIKCGQVRLSTG